ncbi:MAG: hypothetical protein KAS66_06355 [Candidatus Omnitrophica bacterium]|nr:hypothetical protein [Candidatus Omnitrophota bacterium]
MTNLNWRNYNMRCPVFKHPAINPFLLSLASPILTAFIFLTTTIMGNGLLLMLVLAITGLLFAIMGNP